MKNRLYILDGHGLVYRAYYAFIRNPLVTTKGENTSALFGFMRMILRLIHDENPSYMVCIFDAKGKTFRHDRYPEYKAKRLKAPEDLLSQVETIKMVVSSLGIPMLEMAGYEADDLIGALSEKAVDAGMKAIVVSSDKDILQLINESIMVYANKKGISDIYKIDRKEVIDTWGVSPEKVVDVLALTGDQSDNVPGVKGIGQSTAVPLIQKYGSIEELYSRIEEIDDQRRKTLLLQGKESAFLSKELVTLRKDASVDFRKEEFSIDQFPKKEGILLLADKELKSIVEELKGSLLLVEAEEQKRGIYRLVENREAFAKVREKILQKRRVSIDTETTGVDPMSARLIGISLSVDEGEGYYLPIALKEGKELGIEFLKTELQDLLEDESIKKVGQNIKFDFLLLLKHGIMMRGIVSDSMIAAYLLDPQKQRYSLDDLAKEYLDYSTIHYDDIVKQKDTTLLDYSIEDVVEYACEDSDIALRLVNRLEKQLAKENLLRLYREIEIPLLIVLGKMEKSGVRVDSGYLKRMSVEFAEELSMIEEEIYSFAGERFNIRSPKQLSSILFEKLGLPVIKRTKTGISTDESVLEELSRTHTIARFLLRHRTLAKLKSTYVDNLPAMIHPETGRIHTSFNQTIASTGRLSSSNPNLQNIPIREKEGKAIRRAFIPEEEWLFVSADYSQIELRILASLSLDEALMQAFRDDRDVHAQTASLLFGVDRERVDEAQRQIAKTVNFSVIYGISPFGLSKRLGITKSEASSFIDTYFSKYQGVKEYFDGVVSRVKEIGYVETLLGRKRSIPGINSENRNIFEAARRVAINTPIQGTAADLIKKAMVFIDREITERKMKSRMLIQVHDELVFESPRDECELLRDIVKEKMEQAIVFHIPLKVNISFGNNWEEAH